MALQRSTYHRLPSNKRYHMGATRNVAPKRVDLNLTRAGFGSRCESFVNIDHCVLVPVSRGLPRFTHKSLVLKLTNRAATLI